MSYTIQDRWDRTVEFSKEEDTLEVATGFSEEERLSAFAELEVEIKKLVAEERELEKELGEDDEIFAMQNKLQGLLKARESELQAIEPKIEVVGEETLISRADVPELGEFQEEVPFGHKKTEL